MKVKIEFIEDGEECVVIHTKELTPEILQLQSYVQKRKNGIGNLLVYRRDEEYYLPVKLILFVESDEQGLIVHTADDEFLSKDRLYVLEEKLPENFLRVSKSTIINSSYVISIQKSITASSKVSFFNSDKEIYVSRKYYKALRMKMLERST